MRPLIWFRADLRVSDNTALSRATHAASDGAGGGCVAVFVICPKQWQQHDRSRIQVDFQLRSVRVLKEDLEKLNIPLLVRTVDDFAGVPDVLLEIAHEHKCDALSFNNEYEWNEARRDEAVRERFEAAGIRVRSYTDQVVLKPGSVLTKQGSWYSVYSPFKKMWRNVLEAEHGGIWTEDAPKKQAAMVCASDEIPTEVAGFGAADSQHCPLLSAPEQWAELWPAGEHAAKKSLKRFVEKRIGDYKDTRDTPSVDGTSQMSHHLAIGTISPRTCIALSAQANSNLHDEGDIGTVKWIEEVLWREFYKHLLVGFPRLCKHRPFRLDTDAIAWEDNTAHLQAWKDGMTGYPIVDAAMRCLKQTGWMHNRLRMVVAMFFTKHLFLDWRLGEQHFMKCLIDGDLASNNGGWQWSASTGTDAAPYFRIYNPTTQGERHDQEGTFVRTWVPELNTLDAKIIHDPMRSPLAMQGTGYPQPIVENKAARERAIEAFRALKAE